MVACLLGIGEGRAVAELRGQLVDLRRKLGAACLLADRHPEDAVAEVLLYARLATDLRGQRRLAEAATAVQCREPADENILRELFEQLGSPDDRVRAACDHHRAGLQLAQRAPDGEGQLRGRAERRNDPELAQPLTERPLPILVGETRWRTVRALVVEQEDQSGDARGLGRLELQLGVRDLGAVAYRGAVPEADHADVDVRSSDLCDAVFGGGVVAGAEVRHVHDGMACRDHRSFGRVDIGATGRVLAELARVTEEDPECPTRHPPNLSGRASGGVVQPDDADRDVLQPAAVEVAP
jgi:hypothetical protein